MRFSLIGWVDARFPLTKMIREHLTSYYAPKNFNFWYYFGVFSLLVLANQIITGIWLAMYYTPTAAGAFNSVETIMRDVKFGWLIRYMHSTGASAFFVVIYLHMYRCLIYGSYKKPRELVWLMGMAIYMLLLLEAFTGYVLPWGQMSYWGAQVITSLADAVPHVGNFLMVFIRGDYSVSGVTLHRFFSFHVIAIPFIIVGIVCCHLIALHHVGSNNPDGVEIKKLKNKKGKPVDGIPFHPFYTLKDSVAVIIFLIIFAAVIFFAPTGGGLFLEPDNFIPANMAVTPAHIAPIWYMTPFYAMLRAVPNKLGGVVVMGAGVAILWILPWLDRSPVKSHRYKGWCSKLALIIFVISFIVLGYLGLQAVSPVKVILARIFTILYFAFFILMPFYTALEKTKPEPERVTKR